MLFIILKAIIILAMTIYSCSNEEKCSKNVIKNWNVPTIKK